MSVVMEIIKRVQTGAVAEVLSGSGSRGRT